MKTLAIAMFSLAITACSTIHRQGFRDLELDILEIHASNESTIEVQIKNIGQRYVCFSRDIITNDTNNTIELSALSREGRVFSEIDNGYTAEIDEGLSIVRPGDVTRFRMLVTGRFSPGFEKQFRLGSLRWNVSFPYYVCNVDDLCVDSSSSCLLRDRITFRSGWIAAR